MPVVSCPKCPTKLKIPDGVSGNTKCPKCGTVFPVSAPPAFEVVDDTAPASGQAAAPKPAPKPAATDEEPDFEVVDEKPKKRPADDDDDYRPRKKKRANDDDDEDDDEDEPRAKKKGKKKKKRRYDEDEDDDFEFWQPARGGGRGPFANGKTGALLISISFWLNLAAFGLLALYSLLLWILVIAATSSSPSSRSGRSSSSSGGDSDGSFLEVMVVLPGLLGLGAWIVGLIGSAFSIAGPAKARGMAITATVLCSVHLLLTGITFSNLHGSSGFGPGRLSGMGSPAWIIVASTLPVLDSFLPLLFYQSKAVTGDYVIALLASGCEVARLIFMLLTLKALAGAARDYATAEKAQFGVLMSSFIIGGAAIVILFVSIILAESGVGIKTALNLGAVTLLLTFLAYTFMMLTPAMVALQTKGACDR